MMSVIRAKPPAGIGVKSFWILVGSLGLVLLGLMAVFHLYGLQSLWLDVSLTALWFVAPLTVMAWWASRTMTELRVDEDKLKRSERVNRALIEVNEESVLLVSSQGEVLAANPVGAGRLGLAPEEIRGETLDRLLPPDVLERRWPRLRQAIDTGRSVRFEDQRDQYYFEHVIYPIKNEDGEVDQVAIYARNVTEFREAERRLEEIRANLDKAQEVAGMGNMTWDIASGKVSYSKAFHRLLETNPETLGDSYEGLFGFVHPADLERLRSAMAQVVFEEKPLELEHRLIRSDGVEIMVHTLVEVVYDEMGEPIKAVGTFQDITRRKAAERELRIKDYAIRSSINAMALIDLDGRVTYVNPAWLTMWELGSADQVVNREIGCFFGPDGREKISREAGVEAEDWIGEIRSATAQGRPIDALVSLSRVEDERGAPLCFIASALDVTEQKEAEEQLRIQAVYDALTGLYNRRRFMEELEREVNQALRHGYPLTVCICDLDHFKSVNDNYGHQMGDQVLAAFGHMLIEEIRAEDTAGRYGGEEFALILPHTSTDQAVVVLERLRLRWAQRPFEAGGSVFHVTASFGLAAFQTDAPHPETILDRADRALYQAKRTGRNRIRVHGPEAAG